jgi:hypothetical protein
MSTHELSRQLPLPASGRPVTYAVETRVDIRLPGGMQLQQASAALVRQQVLEGLPDGGALIELVTLEQRADDPVPAAALLADVARNNSPLHLRTGATGALRQVSNKAALAAQWEQARPWLERKYHEMPGADALLAQVAGQYAEQTDHLEQALAHKGICAVLLPGCYGLPVQLPAGEEAPRARSDPKSISQFFQGHGLPLRVSWAATIAEELAATAAVDGIGELDRARFDHIAWQQLMGQLRGGPWTGPPPPLQVHWREQYTVSRTGEGLLAGRQGLRVAVQGLYHHEVHHTLRRATTLTADA